MKPDFCHNTRQLLTYAKAYNDAHSKRWSDWFGPEQIHTSYWDSFGGKTEDTLHAEIGARGADILKAAIHGNDYEALMEGWARDIALVNLPPAELAKILELSSHDLSDLGGISDHFANDLLAGRRPFPSKLAQALTDLAGDIDPIADWIVVDLRCAREKNLPIYDSNAALRFYGPALPGRGEARGGFAAIWAAAATQAAERLEAQGIKVKVYFDADPPEF